MSEEEQAAFGKMVKKGEHHIGGVMTIGYAGLILAHLINFLMDPAERPNCMSLMKFDPPHQPNPIHGLLAARCRSRSFGER